MELFYLGRKLLEMYLFEFWKDVVIHHATEEPWHTGRLTHRNKYYNLLKI